MELTRNAQRLAKILFEDGKPEREQEECEHNAVALEKELVFASYWVDTVAELERPGGYRVGVDENGVHWVSRVVGYKRAEVFKPRWSWRNSNGHGDLSSSQLLSTHGGVHIIFEFVPRPGQKVADYMVL
ncbi:hypothetical protein CMP1-52 [Clavibacter phage CMP1]|uniref:Uncharacterized protein n=1 Tax=Clavibacter phage CMP1 TaxID=686439 RepID=D0U236_9CAUD|nr:hypothetical protein CMP1-52 [Clavibacter phage CMP1]ACY35948.1 hypothetical protein CMP1-52 [Clavibacter phage CMP1]